MSSTPPVGIQELPHPKTGMSGMWVPMGLYENMELAYESMPFLQEEKRLLQAENDRIKLSLKLMTMTSTSAQARAKQWERKYDVIFDENLELRFKINQTGDPWWARILTLALGAALAFGSIELAKSTFLER